MRKYIKLPLSGAQTLVIALTALIMWSCDRKSYRNTEGMVWHTTYHITYNADVDLSDSITATLADVGSALNAFDPNSLVSRVNGGELDIVNEDFRKVYEMSCEVNRRSQGAFDPTLGPIITAWGFGKGHRATADTLRIDSLMQFVGIAKTRINGNKIIKDDPRIEFNFSAIAKGYGCDRVAEMMRRNGVEDYLIEIGGEIVCGGVSPQGGKWRISVDKPELSETTLHNSQCIIEFKDMGMATSGNYRNFHKMGESVYGHTISARTGRPVQTDVISATVLAPTAMEADALATAMMAMGSEGSKQLADSLGLPVMLIMSDMSVWQTPEFATLIAK